MNVLITGASRGIGSSIAMKFAENNYNIGLNYLNSDAEALKLKNEIESKYQVKVLLLKGNVGSDAENIISNFVDVFKTIDVLVNNAGICNDKEILENTQEDFNYIFSVNTYGTFSMIKSALPYMEYGSIINISSTNGIDTLYDESILYDASKKAVISLTHSFASALSPNIRVNAVCPGWIDTDMNKDLEPSFKKNEESKIMLNRFGKKEEVASLVYFLASSEASYITNAIIRVDGGKKY